MKFLIASVAGSILLGGALVWLAGPGQGIVTAAQPGPASISEQPASLTSQDALDRVRRLAAIVRRADRAEAKLVTFADYETARGSRLLLSGRVDPAKPLWAVAVGGEIVPEFAKPVPYVNRVPSYTWAVFLVDPTSGTVISTQAGRDGQWPPFFGRLVDRTP